jgi:hypothetical protein
MRPEFNDLLNSGLKSLNGYTLGKVIKIKVGFCEVWLKFNKSLHTNFSAYYCFKHINPAG